MHLQTLEINGQLGGYEELLQGKPAAAIRTMRNIIAAKNFDEASKCAAMRYVLMYAVYSFSWLSLAEVVQVFQELKEYVRDSESINLIKERIAARIRFEQTLAGRQSETVQHYYSDSFRSQAKSSSDRVFCISIPRLADRQRRLYANATQLGYRHIEFRGVDAASLSSPPDFFKFEAPLTTVANILSHMQIWKEIVSENIPGAVVVEDDAIISSQLDWERHRSELSGIDLVFLNNRAMPDYRLVPYDFQPDSGSTYLLPFYFGCGTEGYYVTRHGAERLLELFRVVVAPIDIQIMSHVRSCGIDCEDWQICRQTLNTDQRLEVKRAYPFLVDHPPANYSTATGSFLRGYCPGLWHGDFRNPTQAPTEPVDLPH